MPANSTYTFTAGQILTASDLNSVFAQTVAFAADSSNANTGTLPETRLPYRMNQDVRSNSSVQFVDLSLTGNLTVSGTTTFVNTSVLDVKDLNITLAKGSSTAAAANGAGFTIDGANVGFTYINSTNTFDIDLSLKVGNTVVSAAAVTVNSEFVANTSGVYHSGIVNAATHSVGSNVIANSTGVFTTGIVNAAAITTSGVTTNTSGVYPSSNTVGSALGSSTKKWVITANSVDAETIVVGTVNATAINVGANVVANTTVVAVGNVIANTTTLSINGTVVNSSFFPATANNANYLGGYSANSFVTSGSNSIVTGILTFGNTTAIGNIVFSNGTIVANNSTGLIYYVLTSNGAGGMYWSDLGAIAVNTSAQFSWTNTHTWGNTTQTANVVFANGVIIANGLFGSSGQVLTSNGTAMYWATNDASVNTLQQYVWTNDHSWGNTTQTANVTIANGSLIFSSNNALYANGGFGSNNQVLQSNGSGMFWGNGLAVYYANGSQAYP